MEAGDVFILIEQEKHSLFERINDHDLLVKMTINLNESLTGFKRTLQHLDGRHVLIQHPPNQPIAPSLFSLLSLSLRTTIVLFNEHRFNEETCQSRNDQYGNSSYRRFNHSIRCGISSDEFLSRSFHASSNQSRSSIQISKQTLSFRNWKVFSQINQY